MNKRNYDKPFYQKLWGLMVPIVLQNLMLALVAVADAFMLGGMDQNYMSAVSLATQIQFVQNMFLSAATASLSILGSQYWGKGDVKTLDEIFCMALRLCGLVSVAFFAACVFGGKYLMLIFTNESVLVEYGVNYLRIAGFSYLLTGISQCYLIIMKVSGHAKTTAAVSSATVCINIVLNAIFIYGTFGIPSMGVQGAALATLLARIIELTCSVIISCLLYTSHSKIVNANRMRLHMLAYNLFNWFRRLVLPASMWKQQVDTIRLRLIKIAARAIHSARSITFKLRSSCPYKKEFYRTLGNIRQLSVQLE